MHGNWVLPIIVAGLAAIGVAVLGATITDLGPWYQSLEKPGWTPADPVFGIAWTLIFTLAAVAAVSTWRAAPSTRVSDTIIGLFALNGFLNVLWSLIFFRMQRPDWAFAELLLLWLSVGALVVFCGRYSRLASVALVPYLIWVTIAGALNWQVIELNGPFG
ncbi:TspO/MBR family protein [Qipengyuania qiaonensis]|uniref:Tryptophan-rich sensory protein n=1 Tax=Qipengyuania qiaonensis TaxID=2867240 RepID=A0ABS7JCF5_9SPHN|nr:TspO/MBR family protein [Qipengyuania qiaonensis]MBX7483524.1 tryptophan-rich sensory protein [Qipengyuania qiaonensis]